MGEFEPKNQNILNTSYFLEGKNSPRYYQVAAVNKACQAIAQGKQKMLIVMATGTGKTFVAAQITHRFLKSQPNKSPRILYLVDRNNLADQSINGDFKYLKNATHKYKNRKIDSAHSIYFGLYQQFIDYKDNGEIIKHFTNLASDFFDLIFVDECHRGSVKKDSAWREILNYFNSAIQIGMTATPRSDERDSNDSNIGYFGEPIYTYSLKNGIEDGYLAPFKVCRFDNNLDKYDLQNLLQEAEFAYNQNGEEILIDPKDYKNQDKQRRVFFEELLTQTAQKIIDYNFNILNDPYAKTIVFCNNSFHAELMALYLRNEVAKRIESSKDSRLLEIDKAEYVRRIVSKERNCDEYLEKFIDTNKKYPVIATTSKLLTTGADTKMVKTIALCNSINSMIEFKQIIGRGTRLVIDEKYNRLVKAYFTILDFSGATRLFNDPAFDGEAIEIIKPESIKKPTKQPQTIEIPESIIVKTAQEGIFINTQTNSICGIDEDGDLRLISTDFLKYSKENLTKHYTREEFIKAWQNATRKSDFIDEFEKRGIFINSLKQKEEFKNKDEFDILLHIAYGESMLTRKERAKKANKELFKYSKEVREILEILLEKYEENGIIDIENPNIFATDPFNYPNTMEKVKEIFGSIQIYKDALQSIKTALYAQAS